MAEENTEYEVIGSRSIWNGVNETMYLVKVTVVARDYRNALELISEDFGKGNFLPTRHKEVGKTQDAIGIRSGKNITRGEPVEIRRQ